MKLRNMVLWSMMIAAAATSGAAVSEHYPINATIVAATISRTWAEVSPDQITLPADVVATTPAPVLRVRSVKELNNDRLLARLECVNRDECLPFFVDIHVTEPQIAAAAAAGAPHSLSSTDGGGGALAVRSGSQVTLILDGDHVHIRIRAICLQGGSPGQMIRVSDTNHRLIYPAQVVDALVVKGRLK